MDDGYAILPTPASASLLAALRDRFAAPSSDRRGGVRNALEVPEVCAAVNELRPLACRLGGTAGMRCVRGIVFDKTPASNWKVSWHQDRSIAVAERLEVPGFGPWSRKAGVEHVQPPAAVLEGMVTLRLHLDPCGDENGPLRVLPGTHKHGILDDAGPESLRARLPEVALTCAAGDVVAMRPLLVHASSAATRPTRRRVVHLEFSLDVLPAPLAWQWAL